jgi:hypothetical protein
MLNHCMPAIIAAVGDLIELCGQHGDENVKFPIVMFREKELQRAADATPQQAQRQAAADASLHSGNLLEVIDQVRFYFRGNEARQGTTTARSPQGTATQMSSQYLRDVESKIRALSTMQFAGDEGEGFGNADALFDSDSDAGDGAY